MATFHRTKTGTAWLSITCDELRNYSGMDTTICDHCLAPLAGRDNITLIPILNIPLSVVWPGGWDR